MKTPPLLLGLTLLFWGWQSGYLLAAALMAALLESSRLIAARWVFSDQDFDRLGDFGAVLFLGAALYAFTSNQGPSAFMELLQSPAGLAGQKGAIDQTLRATLVFTRWLPMIFFPFMAAQAFSQRDKIGLSAFSWLLRRRGKHRPNAKSTRRILNVSHPYFAVCLASACIGRPENAWFYPVLCVILAWAMWPERSPRFAIPVWAASALAAAVLGYAGQRGLYQLHGAVQSYYPEWLSNLMRREFDPKESRTSLGHIGRLKRSAGIVLRVTPGNGQRAPSLLRQASYRAFRSPTWFGAGADKDFEIVPPEPNESTWWLLRQKPTTADARIAGFLNGGHGLLALPNGTARLENLPVSVLKTNRLGTVRVDSGPGLVIFDAHYGPGATIDSPPGAEDLQVPEKESAAVSRIASELGLAGQTPTQTLRTLAAFFQDKCRYSVWRPVSQPTETNQTPLASFLLRERAGHCEYFATATVLLLREAGIPARYAVGYAVQEKTATGFIVRERHAHAWCLVHRDGAWHDFDTTPASWFDVESANASGFELLSDAWSRLWFEFTKLRYGQSGLRAYVWWLVLPGLILALGQFLLRKQWRRSRHDPNTSASALALPGMDSEFYLIERALADQGLGRQRSETAGCWLRRARTGAPVPAKLQAPLARILRLHYQYRFDPRGLSSAERKALRAEAASCLAALRRKP